MEVDRRWVKVLKREIQAAEVTLVAELGARRSYGGAAAGHEAWRLYLS